MRNDFLYMKELEVGKVYKIIHCGNYIYKNPPLNDKYVIFLKKEFDELFHCARYHFLVDGKVIQLTMSYRYGFQPIHNNP